MKISLNWLRRFVDITETDQDKIKAVITARTAEIETMENRGAHLEGIVLGKIEKLLPHPNADKLRLTLVNDGQRTLQVVCGGSNLKEGMKVAFAQIGSVVKWHGTETVKLEHAKIRGEESHGMICAAEEIGLAEMFPKKEEKEIVDLSALDFPLGTPLAKALGLDDVVIDIDNHAITHRADLFSHRGFAREFVANKLAVWKKDAESIPSVQAPHAPLPVSIEIADPDLCSRYLAVYITDVGVSDSPDWMKKHLSACGVRPICNLVDITNYVMLELGMPLHAFDPDRVKGKKWLMRASKKGEKIVTLDEKEIELFEGVTVMDDGHELFDLCGIMGGFSSGIHAKTNRIVLHAPVYNPKRTRRAMRGLGFVSDAAIIYEKGVDSELALDGLNRAVQLILELCPGAKAASRVLDIQNEKLMPRKLTLHQKQIKRLIGDSIPPATVKTILSTLGFSVKEKKEDFEVTVPSWRRNDVNIEADLIEEAARIYSYDQIPFTMPVMDITPIAINHERVREREIKNRLVSFGFNEIYTFAFLGSELLAKCAMNSTPETIEVKNPISADMSLMRQSLLPRTLEAAASNLRYQKTFRLFEMTRVYTKKGADSEEKTSLILAGVNESFRDLQGVVEKLGFVLTSLSVNQTETYQHPGRAAALMAGDQRVGFIYELHPAVEKNFDLKAKVIVAEIDLSAVHSALGDKRVQYRELPKFPAIQLDVSLLIPKKTLAKTYTQAIQKTDRSLIKSIQLIDEYAGENLGKDKRSLTYSIMYRSDEKTLTEEEALAVHQKVIGSLQAEGAEVRIK